MKKWKPKEGETYWAIRISDGGYYELRTTFTEWDSEDILNAETGNCFKTEEEAQAMLTKIKKLLKGEKP